MKLAFATGNIHKLREASEILGEGFELVTPSSLGLDADIPETGKTLRANSLLKAQYIFDHLGCDCFADDTGLEVEILGGAPGVYTARYAGPGGDSAANIAKLLREMASMEMSASQARAYGLDTVHASRRARFCTIVTLFLGGEYYTFEGIMPGRIAIARSGSEGFGYDPVFIPDEIPAWAAPGAAGGAASAGGSAAALASVAKAPSSAVAKVRTSKVSAAAGQKPAATTADIASASALASVAKAPYASDIACASALAPVAGTAGDAIALVPNVWRLTCADIPEEAKNAISHRGRALRAMADFLRSRQSVPKRA
ncbi:MAG: hypothetical protein IKR15_05535 [Bacteroidales bacterium]|nr:hypothetical protein [Bacteroidales bacterium]